MRGSAADLRIFVYDKVDFLVTCLTYLYLHVSMWILAGRCSSVGSASASKQSDPEFDLSCREVFPFGPSPVVSYSRKNAHLILVNFLREAFSGTVD